MGFSSSKPKDFEHFDLEIMEEAKKLKWIHSLALCVWHTAALQIKSVRKSKQAAHMIVFLRKSRIFGDTQRDFFQRNVWKIQVSLVRIFLKNL